MKNRTKYLLAGLGLAGAGIGLSLWSGAARWNSRTRQLVEKQQRSAFVNEPKTVSFSELDGLPAPVARYFRYALKDGQPVIRTARIRHAGEFYLNEQWIPFESEEYFSARPPAFVWDANMKMNAVLNIRVRDGYGNGRGRMLAKILALVTVMNAGEAADEKLAAGALQRYLAEAVWLPIALLPDENLHWSAIDDDRARATLTDSGVTVSLDFEFDQSGGIVGTFSPARYREIDGQYNPFPWKGRFRNYREYGGMMVPTEGEVEWQLTGGNLPYWRGRLLEAVYGL